MTTAVSNTVTFTVSNPATTYLGQQAALTGVGQWRQISTNGLTVGMFVTGANSTLDWSDKGVYDPLNKQMRFIGNGHLEELRWHQYDETTNTWSTLPPPSWYPGGPVWEHGYHHNTIDPATGDQYYRHYNGGIERFNRSAGTWSSLPSAGTMGIAGSIEWLSTIGAQGGLVFHVGPDVKIWNKATNGWTTASSGLSAGPYHNVGGRNNAINEVYIGGGNGSSALHRINGSGTITSLASCPITYGFDGTIQTVCPASGHLIVIAPGPTAYKFNGTSWASYSMSGAPSFSPMGSGARILATPISAYGVVMWLFGRTPAVYLHRIV